MNLPDLLRCSRCVIPETHETITFDERGVCNVCRQHEIKKTHIDWKAKEGDLVALIEQHRGRAAYDCIVPFSGGKDTTYTLHTLVTRFKLRPLAVTFDHGFFRPRTLENVARTMRKLGVDHLKFAASPQIVKRLMLEGLKRKGDFCWHCHTGIFAYPMQIAAKFQIPLLIWGEPSAEYTAYYTYEQPEEVDERRFNRFINLGITAEDMVGMLGEGVALRDLEPFRYPPLKELRALRCRSVCLGSYIPWDVRRQTGIIKRELGWQGDDVEGVPGVYDYEKVECMFTGVRDYCKYIKRGYARASHLASIDIRHHRLMRDEALHMVRQYEGKRPASLDVFLRFVGINEEEFMGILLRQMVSPHVHDPTRIEAGERLWDHDRWTAMLLD